MMVRVVRWLEEQLMLWLLLLMVEVKEMVVIAMVIGRRAHCVRRRLVVAFGFVYRGARDGCPSEQ